MDVVYLAKGEVKIEPLFDYYDSYVQWSCLMAS